MICGLLGMFVPHQKIINFPFVPANWASTIVYSLEGAVLVFVMVNLLCIKHVLVRKN
jgi:uncharacterized membrane protein YeaQ/YmgE (transglycosylase-associated protein family)